MVVDAVDTNGMGKILIIWCAGFELQENFVYSKFELWIKIIVEWAPA